MIRAALLSILLCLTFYESSSQDTLTISDKSVIEVRILEIGSQYVIYKKWDKQEPYYRINKSEISKIKFDLSTDIILRDSRPVLGNYLLIQKLRDKMGYLVDEDYVRSFWKLGEYINPSHRSHAHFLKGLKYKNKTTTLRLITPFTFAGGLLILHATQGSDNTFRKIGLLSSTVATPMLWVTSIFLLKASNSQKKKVEESFVFHSTHSEFIVPESYVIHLGFTSNGAGIVVSF
jgi:hypothetical protein